MSSVNYFLMFKGDSHSGGPVSSVRSFSKLEAARRAMVTAYQKEAATLGIPAGSNISKNPSAIQTKDRIHLERHGDWFQWEIVKAVPEDGDLSEPGNDSRRGLTSFTAIIEEHIAQEFPVEAYDIFHALNFATKKYEDGELIVQSTTPNARLIMVRDDETGETTEWKDF